jgi:hypothetical protein
MKSFDLNICKALIEFACLKLRADLSLAKGERSLALSAALIQAERKLGRPLLDTTEAAAFIRKVIEAIQVESTRCEKSKQIEIENILDTNRQTEFVNALSGSARCIGKLPTENGKVEIKIEPLTALHCNWWHKNVQAHIDANGSGRADTGWNWKTWFLCTKLSTSQCPVYGLAVMGQSKSATGEVQYLPMGLTIVVKNYPSFSDNSKKSSYLWFLSALPNSLYQDLGFENYKAVGRAVIDAVLCDTFNNWMLGVVGLHADPAGGENLPDWYRKIGMEQIDPAIAIPKLKGHRRKNDGRFFTYLPKTNLEAYFDHMDWR